MKNITLSLAMIALVASVVIGGTTAFFSDEETSEGNVFAAGAIDLKIDNSSYGFDYNDPTNDDPSGIWGPNDANTWQLDDLTDQLFFDFVDLKPGDYGEDTISIHVDDNDAWACMAFDLTGTPENGQNEPEEDVDPTAGDDEGELQNYLSFLFWWDDGDNVLEDGEQVLESLSGLPGEIFTGTQLAIADSNTGEPLPGGETLYLGKGWCFGEITPDPVDQDDSGDNPPSAPDRIGFTCNGEGDHNDAQTDGIEVDVSFYAEQSRNNPDFVCEGGDDGIGCQEEADVMLVLDSSGSIGGDMDALKDAAKEFVTTLSPSTDGVHIGVVDFDDDATLEEGLTDNVSDINNAIDGLVSEGLTNLEAGIRVAQTQLDGSRAGVPDFMVIITDGDPTAQDGTTDADGSDDGEAEDAANDAKGAGTEIFAVGVGGGVDSTYLENSIVSSPSDTHYADSDNFDDLEQTLQDLTSCPDDDDGDQRESVGAALAAYSAPTCNVTVDGQEPTLDTIQEAVDSASAGQTVCVPDGNYNETVTIGKALTLASLNGPTNSATIEGGVRIESDDVTLTGFIINPGSILGSNAAVYFNGSLSNIEISYNDIDGLSEAASRGVETGTGQTYSNVSIMNNHIHDLTTGIYLNPLTGLVTIESNDIDDNAAGIGGLNGASVTNNEFEHTTPGSEAIGADTSHDSNPASVNFNNFLDGTMLNTYGGLATDVDAENNFWGPDGGDAQTGGTDDVDFDPEEVSPFPHN